MSLPSISPSVSMCKLQRQHHMAPDSSHTFSTKQLKPCQREREWSGGERHTEAQTERQRQTALHPGLPSVCGDAVLLVRVSVRLIRLISLVFMSICLCLCPSVLWLRRPRLQPCVSLSSESDSVRVYVGFIYDV